MGGAGSTTGSDGVAGMSFLDRLPVSQARQAFLAWRAAQQQARTADGLPQLMEFAPYRLPPATMPWVLIHRERADGEIVYGLAGEELIHLFGRNPKGQPVLSYAAPEERARRLAVIREAMHTGRPVWFVGSLLFANKETVPVGRLGLPARNGKDRVLVLIYFLLGAMPASQRRPSGAARFETQDVFWCPADELVAPGSMRT